MCNYTTMKCNTCNILLCKQCYSRNLWCHESRQPSLVGQTPPPMVNAHVMIPNLDSAGVKKSDQCQCCMMMTKGQGLQKEESRKLHFYASQKCSTCEFRICNNCISSNAFDHNLCCLRSQPPAGFANWLEFLRTSRKRSENRR